ncbi:uncharacterized protein, MTH1187 family [Desulfofundulus australicus DSM 11792]|uniref:Uncharacterized protein, MTH1187 family n=1 Tax=Desulfofundulus australicus DSM 11792 TaxID=1121425 RepID=A0A1M4T2L9_9FIRM|nr:MTH1187 family thiamine-binding protein [Desulfofundulus australicus]SHE38696.1 uncharacterized protein, MTH1187 family [Desulfofundulus australicus DSM 11792]
MAVVEVSIVPVGTGDTSLSAYVARCLEVLKDEKHIRYQLTPMGTIIEGDLDVLLAVIRRMHEVPFGREVTRVVTTIRIDDRRDKELTMAGKVAAVEEKIK